MNIRIILTFSICIAAASAQYDSPAPPRPIIPGAVPLQVGPRPAVRRRPVAAPIQDGGAQPARRVIGGRNGAGGRRLPPPLLEQSLQARPAPRPLFQDAPIPVVRAPQPPLQSPSVSPRPVIEELEEEENLPPQASPSPLPQASPSPSPIQSVSQQSLRNIDDFPVPSRQQYRPQPQQNEEPQFNRQLRPQPQERQERPQERQERPQQKQYAQQQYNRQQQVARPAVPRQQPVAHSKDISEVVAQPTRSRKPVVQVIKKFRDDNPDGSITWGFENDDGTYKEETIGTDCVTRGKYGYFDPDGVKREFTYSSGIPCDPATRGQDSETQATNEGYIDYSNNRYVYPNGDSIGLDNMVRNRARKQAGVRN